MMTELETFEHLDRKYLKRVPFIRHLLPSYFRPYALEKWKKGLIYKCLGVHFFGKIIPTGGIYWRRFTGWKMSSFSLENNTLSASRAYLYKASFFEFLHTCTFIFYTVIIIYRFIKGYNELAVSNIQQNFIINVYPIMLQRYNRLRIFIILEKRKSRSKNINNIPALSAVDEIGR